ncbi:uncharacterized protein TM35_000311390 [Trypanosoma theileri]|uniref:Uncharacterized protein n=1 Tax=Trypanosoma theileri TaxID=67003 RepID=A0A1X0NN80_9TRYP|nr:uncharacterized protein TM35_000311390 [Trypanosoma theileri]ORC85953.1 hypothetical protein TM35_000311390 [Trypanosoma theileri]
MTQASTSVLSNSPKLFEQQDGFEDIRVSIERIQLLLERGETLLYGEEVQRELFPTCASHNNAAVAAGNGKNIYQPEEKKKKPQFKQNSPQQQKLMYQNGGSKVPQQGSSPFNADIMNKKDYMTQRSVLRRKNADSLTTTPQQQSVSPGNGELSKSTNSKLSKSSNRSVKLKRLGKDMHECDDDDREDISIEELLVRIRRELQEYRSRNNHSLLRKSPMAPHASL